jgi:hypothetical protein
VRPTLKIPSDVSGNANAELRAMLVMLYRDLGISTKPADSSGLVWNRGIDEGNWYTCRLEVFESFFKLNIVGKLSVEADVNKGWFIKTPAPCMPCVLR